ncbi:hypothetical protein ACF1DV_29010 [Streptomyces achromogenes]|uniref:hypothetical protein n=1 Tax=Streptomyces achromogenes TaxID=67255 RepID=UPI0036F83A99
MWSSVVAVLGTLAGAALAGYVQRSGDRRARDHAHRQEVARAVAELLEAIVRHREVHWLAVESRRAGAGETEEERTARATTRSAATVARDRLGLPIWGVSASLGSVWGESTGQDGTPVKDAERHNSPGQQRARWDHRRSAYLAGRLRTEIIGLDDTRDAAAGAQGFDVAGGGDFSQHLRRLPTR